MTCLAAEPPSRPRKVPPVRSTRRGRDRAERYLPGVCIEELVGERLRRGGKRRLLPGLDPHAGTWYLLLGDGLVVTLHTLPSPATGRLAWMIVDVGRPLLLHRPAPGSLHAPRESA